jgi:uncharacterized protein (TIGR03382 family)
MRQNPLERSILANITTLPASALLIKLSRRRKTCPISCTGPPGASVAVVLLTLAWIGLRLCLSSG